MHGLVPCMSTENLHSANSLLVDNLSRFFYLLPKYFFQSKCISSNVSFMFLHSAGLIQVRMDLVLAHTFHSIYMYFFKYILSLFQMFLHSAALIQVRMIDIFSFHSFLCNNFSASRLSSHFHFLILMEPTLPLVFSNMIYSLQERSFTHHINQYQYFC